MSRCIPLLFAIACGLAACSSPPNSGTVCKTADVIAANDSQAIRNLLDRCSDDDEIFVRALMKLNGLPPPRGRKLALSPPAPYSESERVVMEADVFFDWLIAFPSDIAFEKLDELIQKVNATYRIESIQLVGSEDRVEKRLPSFETSRQRAEFIKQYFLAAGVPGDLPINWSVRDARHPDTPEGNARDRSVAMRIVALRRKTAPALAR